VTVIKAFPCELSGRLGNDDHLCLAKSRVTPLPEMDSGQSNISGYANLSGIVEDSASGLGSCVITDKK